VGALRQIAVSEGLVIPAGSLGKFKTAYQSTALGFLLFHYDGFGMNAHTVGMALLWQSMVLSVVSGLQYAWGYAQHRNARLAAEGT
jgi:CDP-diacylglycerol--glycerol-3-phosphate 3-phosphatidyltransferase